MSTIEVFQFQPHSLVKYKYNTVTIIAVLTAYELWCFQHIWYDTIR